MIKLSFKLAKRPRCCCPRKSFLEIRNCATTRPTHASIQSSSSSFQIRNRNYFDGEWYQASNIPRFCTSPISFCNNCPIDMHTCLQEKFCFFFQNAFQLTMLVLITAIIFGHLVQFIYLLNSLKYKRETILILKHKENLWIILQMENYHTNVVIQVGFLEYRTSWRLN